MLPETHLQRPVLAARGRGPPLPRGAHGGGPARRQEEPHVPARHDALRRQAQLPGGAGGDRRQSLGEMRALDGRRSCVRCGRPTARSRKRATGASRWISTCPSARIVLDEQGRVARVVVPERLAAHRLIEEFMIQANVAAAEALEGKRAPVVYRIHDQPSKEKLKSLREFLDSLEIRLAPQGTLKPEHFNRILARAKSMPVPSSSTRSFCAARARPSTTSTTSATSVSTCAATHTSPRPSAATPISSPTAPLSAP